MLPGVLTHGTAPVSSTGTTDGGAGEGAVVGVDAATGADATGDDPTDCAGVDDATLEPVAFCAGWPGAAQPEIATTRPATAAVL